MTFEAIKFIVNANVDIRQAIATDDAAFTRSLFLTDASVTTNPESRTILVNPSNYSDYLDAFNPTFAKNFFATLFQPGGPSDALLAKWHKVPTGTYHILRSPYLAGMTPGPSNATFGISEDGGLTTAEEFTVDLTVALDGFTVAGILTTAIRASGTLTNPLDYNVLYDDTTGEFTLFYNGTTGSATAIRQITAGTTGTPITGTNGLNIADSVYVPGYDAETVDQALDAVIDSNPASFMFVNVEQPATEADIRAVETWCGVNSKIQIYVTNDPVTKSEFTSDNVSIMKSLSSKNTFAIYTEHERVSGGVPVALGGEAGAAMLNKFTTKSIGAYDVAKKPLSNVATSGKDLSGDPKDLTPSEKTYLQSKNCSYVTDIGFNVLDPSRMISGVELRVLVGALYMNYRMQLSIINWMSTADAVTFSNDDLAILKSIVDNWLTWGANQGFILDDFTINIPDAATIDAATKASGLYTNLDLYVATINSAIYKFNLLGVLKP